MKKVVFLFFLLAVGVGFMNVSRGSAFSPETVVTAPQEEREKIKREELPELIKTALNGDEYKGWLVNAAYRIKSKDIYEVELKKGAESKTIRFDKEGKVLV